MLESTTCPCPVERRASRAARAPRAANIPARESPRLTPTRTGGRSGYPDERPQPAHRFADGGVPGQGREGSGLAVAADAHDDESRVGGVQRLPAESPPFERAGAEVLDQDVGVRSEVADEALPLLLTQVDRDAALVATRDLPPDAAAWCVAAAPLPQNVARSGGSTLMTSAPRSPSSCPQNGPAITWPSSMTRMPASGPAPADSADEAFIRAQTDLESPH